MTTRIDLINRALAEIGAAPVVEDVAPGPDRVAEYETHIGALVSFYPWSFQSRLRQLARKSDAPAAHWLYAFALPSDMLGSPRALYPTKDERRPTAEFELLAGELLSNEPELWMRYPFLITPAVWPAHFTLLAVTALKAQFALSVREDATLHGRLRRLAFGAPEEQMRGGMAGAAMTIDAQSQPSRVIQIGSNPLIAARGAGGRYPNTVRR